MEMRGRKPEVHCRRTFCGEIISTVEAIGVEISVSGRRGERDIVDPEVKEKVRKGANRDPEGSRWRWIRYE